MNPHSVDPDPDFFLKAEPDSVLSSKTLYESGSRSRLFPKTSIFPQKGYLLKINFKGFFFVMHLDPDDCGSRLLNIILNYKTTMALENTHNNNNARRGRKTVLLTSRRISSSWAVQTFLRTSSSPLPQYRTYVSGLWIRIRMDPLSFSLLDLDPGENFSNNNRKKMLGNW